MRSVMSTPRTVVTARFTSWPMTSRRAVNTSSGTSANGRPNDSATWLSTRACVGSVTTARMARAGTADTARRTQMLLRRRRNPCMTACPL